MLPYCQPGGVVPRVADRRVQYTAPHCGVRVLYRLGAQCADPGRRRDIGAAEILRLGTEWGNTAVQGRDDFFVAGVRLLQAARSWSSPEPGDPEVRSNLPGYMDQIAGSPRPVRPVEPVP